MQAETSILRASRNVPSVVAVTVTYGARWDLLRQTLLAAQNEGADFAVVVDNGASEPIAARVLAQFGTFAEVLSLHRNTGSALGFKTGMQHALKRGADYILLLDDDNQMQQGCLAALASTYDRHSQTIPRRMLAVLAYRADRQADAAAGLPANGMGDDRSAFFGFHMRDLPFKLFRRTPWGRAWVAQRRVAENVQVASAPYSGMYFHRSMLEFIGMPNEKFLLYADDTDFTYRLTSAGGRIVLATNAQLHDLESSWNVRTRFSNTFDALLLGDGDFRAYYSTRNNAYFERWSRRGDGIVRAINRAVYLIALYLRAAIKGRRQRYALLLAAINDGEAGRLGEHPDFPLDPPLAAAQIGSIPIFHSERST